MTVHFAKVAAISPDTQHPLMAWAKRILAVGKPSLLAQAQTAQGWATLVWQLQQGIATSDLDLLHEVLLTAKGDTYIPSSVSLPAPTFDLAA